MRPIRPLPKPKSWRFFNSISAFDYMRQRSVDDRMVPVRQIVDLWDAGTTGVPELQRSHLREHHDLVEMTHSVYLSRFRVLSVSSGRSAASINCLDLDDNLVFLFSSNSFHPFFAEPRFADTSIRRIEAEIFFEKRGSTVLAVFV